jgi:hypothetical protein
MKVPATVSFAIFSCYKLQTAEALAQFLLFLASEAEGACIGVFASLLGRIVITYITEYN